MPKSTLQWDFHDDSAPSLEDYTPDSPRPRGAFPWRRLLALALVGVILLAVAGAAGFGVGRYQRSATAARTDLQATIDLETWAWQSGSRSLFSSAIDMAGRPDWRRELERQFEASGKDIRAVTLRGLRFLDDTLVEAEVDVTDNHGVRRETRYYRLLQGQWRRTSPPVR